MSRNQERAVLRRATLEDYADVVAMGDVYNGRDYLPHFYHSFLSDPNVYAIVAEVKGRVVGFYMLHLVDGGKVAVKRAGRVHSLYRGGGIFHQLSVELEAIQKTYFPEVQRILRATNTPIVTSGYRECFRKDQRSFIFDPKDFKSFQNEVESSVLPMAYRDIKQLFELDDIMKRLFPMKMLINYYVPYKCNEVNIRHFLGEGKEVFASTEIVNQNQRVKSFDKKMLASINMLSFSFHFHGTRGLLYVLDLYAIDFIGEVTIRSHISRHVHRIRMLSQEKGVLLITFGPNIDEEMVRSCLRDAGIDQPLPVNDNLIILYEKN